MYEIWRPPWKSGRFFLIFQNFSPHLYRSLSQFEVKEALGVVLNLPADRRVPCGVFGSFGWSGEAVDELQFRLTLGKQPFDGVMKHRYKWPKING